MRTGCFGGFVIETHGIGVGISAAIDGVNAGIPVDAAVSGDKVLCIQVLADIDAIAVVVDLIAHGIVDHSHNGGLNIVHRKAEGAAVLGKDEFATGCRHSDQFFALVGEADGEHRTAIVLESRERAFIRGIFIRGNTVGQDDQKLLGGGVGGKLFQSFQRAILEGGVAVRLPGQKIAVFCAGLKVFVSISIPLIFLSKPCVGNDCVVRKTVS